MEGSPVQSKNSWRLQAACRELGGLDDHDRVSSFYLVPMEPVSDAVRRACAGCPVRKECLAEALANGEQFGIWGGLRPSERAALRKQLAAEGVMFRFGTCQWCSARFGIPAGTDSRKYCPPPKDCAEKAAEAREVGRRLERSAGQGPQRGRSRMRAAS
jgi:hypothetical protein